MQILLDGVDVTADINKVATISTTDGGVYPNDRTKWFDMLYIIDKHPELNDFFGKGGLHTLKIVGDPAYNFTAKIILRATYSARNC